MARVSHTPEKWMESGMPMSRVTSRHTFSASLTIPCEGAPTLVG